MTVPPQPSDDSSRPLPLKAIRMERTHEHDQGFREWFRRWSEYRLAGKLSLLAWEPDPGKAAALIEYKHETEPEEYLAEPKYRALSDLGDRAGLPVLAVRYAADFSWWRVTPLNKIAKTHLPEQRTMTEQGWVTFLYSLRGHQPPPGLFDVEGVLI